MGLFRMIFATTVMLNHSFPIFGYALLGPDIAVRAFFIVSGFYMGLILNEKYIKKNSSYWLFLSNRFLRIYPLYLVVLLIICVFTIYWLHTGQEKFFVLFLRSIQGLPFPTQVFLSIDELIRNLTLIITAQATTQHNYLLVNQGWTLQLEILFYIFVPFFARKFRFVIVAILLSLALRHMVSNGILDPEHTIHNQSMVYAFIQNNIYFLLGLVAYKLYVVVKHISFPSYVLPSIFFLFLIITFLYPFFLTESIPSHPHARDWIYYISFSATIPFIFVFTQKNKTDNFIGSLSYPFYIIHYLILEILLKIFGMNAQTIYWTIAGFICSIIASILLLKLMKPLEVYREKRIQPKNKRKKKDVVK